jgi:hypothetical protein
MAMKAGRARKRVRGKQGKTGRQGEASRNVLRGR